MKQKVKEKSFKKGDQCVQNPKSTKFRSQVKRNVFTKSKQGGGLTLGALDKHNEAMEVLDFSELAISEKTGGTSKSGAFSISGLTDCTNMTFCGVLEKWRSPNALDREKCAILAAVTEVIRAKGGEESETEYFAALMTTISNASNEEEESVTAIAFLLALVMKKLQAVIIRAKFSQCAKLFMEFLGKFYDNGRASLLISLLDCLSCCLSSAELAVWQEASTKQYFQALLMFTVHQKPRVRKAAHHNIKSVLKIVLANHKNHPAGPITSKYCWELLKKNDVTTQKNHVLNLLKQSLSLFAGQNLKELCEAILAVMSTNDLIAKTNSMETLHALFTSNPSDENLSSELNAKLIAAVYDFQPSVNDTHVAEGWLALQASAHNNLSLLNSQQCLMILPKFFNAMVSFFSSEHRNVVDAAAQTIRDVCKYCLEPFVETLVEEANAKPFKQIIDIVESGMRYKYQPVWNVVLRVLQYFYATFGAHCHSAMLKGVGSLIDLHSSPDFPYKHELTNAVGAAVKGLGPKLVLEHRPLQLIREDNVCSFPRAWLLPVMKDNIEKSQLQFFVSHFLPMAAQLRQKAAKSRELKQDLEAKVYETLQTQIWMLLPGFCNNPTDLAESFKNIAMILGTALNERKDLCAIVLQALRTIINKSEFEMVKKTVGFYTKNYLPILFNLYTSDEEDNVAISLSVLDTIKMFLIVTEEKLINSFVTRVFTKIEEETNDKKRHSLMDLAVLMVKYSDEHVLRKFYLLACKNLNEKDKSMQKKGYRIIEELCESNSEAAKELVTEKFDDLKEKLVESLSTAAPSSKAPRLRCLSLLVKKLNRDQKDFLATILPEIILCTKEVGVKAKTAAFDLLVDIGTTFVFLSDKPKEECVEDYFKLAMAGLAGSPHMISATLLAFTKLIFEYRYCIASYLVASLLDAAIVLLKSKVKEVIKSSLLFIRAVVKILDANELNDHLPSLIRNLFAWNANSSSAYRQQVRIILERLDKKCGYEKIRPLTPDQHRRFVVQIHKTLMRTKRQKEAKRNAENEDNEVEEKKGSSSWEDVLADSDDETETNYRQKDKKRDKKKPKENKSWIVEGGEEEVDLLDAKIAKNIVATQPKKRFRKLDNDFTINEQGKLMINDDEDEKHDLEDTPLNIGQTDMLAGFDKTPKQIKLGKRKHLEDMPEEEMGYQPGGRGIHRDDTQPKKLGEEYKAKKAKGDVKLKGKPDPYAYIPLDRKSTNKRKRAKMNGQFNGLLKAAKRGADKGAKNRRK